MRLILASESEGKRDMMDLLGIPYEAIPSNLDETMLKDWDYKVLVQMISIAKAKIVADIDEDAVVVGSDIFVTLKDRDYQKPANLVEAFGMLRSLSGQTMDIIGGVAVYRKRDDKLLSCSDSTKVTFRDLSDGEINRYINAYPVKKYSAAFDRRGLKLFAKEIHGSTTGIAPIPMHKLIEFLKEFSAYH